MAQDGQYGSVRVKVFDAESGKPISFASVYLDRTTIGGYTDEKGDIEVKKIPFGAYVLVISSVEFKPQQRKLIIKSEQPVYISTKLAPQLLAEVQVKAKRDDKWARQLSRFERLFFGSDHFKECRITNPWVLNFKTTAGDFIAEASEPLKIENNFLGYDLSFEVKTCSFSDARYIIKGNVKFEEKKTTDSILVSKWRDHRVKIYRGSPQHFFRSLINHNEAKDGYETYADLTSDGNIDRRAYFLQNVGRLINPTSFEGRVKQSADGSLYTIQTPTRLEVHYLRKRAQRTVYQNVMHAVTFIEIKTGSLVVNRYGVPQNPENLIVMGNMGDLRVADWLPIDYEDSHSKLLDPIVAPPSFFSDLLLEKPYIHTDRDYYYNRDTMWMKGYMNYLHPLLKDSLSHSIYVDLVSSDGNIVRSRYYQVDSGRFTGNLPIDASVKPGAYQLKAYTSWMLNFNPGLIFTKTINVLNPNQAVRMPADYNYEGDSTTNVTIRTNKESYHAREIIIVSIDVLDSLDLSTAADISISVTDIEQAVPRKDEKTILDSYPFDTNVLKDSTYKRKYNIEYGIDFKGKFRLGKKPAQGIITVFQDKPGESFGIITDSVGQFSRRFWFSDTAKFYLQAVSANKKKGVVIVDSAKRAVAPVLKLEPVLLDLYTSDNIRRDMRLQEQTVVLKEATVKSTRIVTDKPRVGVVHSSADYLVTSDWIERNNIMDVATALSMKVPGMGGSLAMGVVRLGPVSSFGSQPPLVVVDGVPQPETSKDLLNDIPILSIDRIEILKLGSAASYGSRGANGVIAIFTKKGFSGVDASQGFDKKKLQPVTLVGYSPVADFTIPDYSKPVENDYFDYRATIFWNPTVTTDGKSLTTLFFYAADAATTYRIVVEGITRNGQAVRGEKVVRISADR